MDMIALLTGMLLGSGLVLAAQEIEFQFYLRNQRRQAELDEAIKLANEDGW